MSWFLGSMSFRRGGDAPSSVRNRLFAVRDRYPSTVAWREFTASDFLVLKGSVGAYTDFGMVVDSLGMCAQTGEALLPDTIGTVSSGRRSVEAAAILHAFVDDNASGLLTKSRGTFACMAYDAGRHRALLATDKLGVRPLYYFMAEDAIYFGTSRRDLVAILDRRPAIDLQGFAELLAFDYAFEDRTGISGVKVLRPGAALIITEAGIEERCYYDLRNAARREEEKPFDTGSVFETFVDAVRIRVNDDSNVASFLSGGLDSRTVCAVLRQLSVEVSTANFASPTSTDTYCSERAAEVLHTRHTTLEFASGLSGEPYSKRISQKWVEALEAAGDVQRPRLVWSGDGGSVGLGCVYLTEDACALADQGHLAEAITAIRPPIAFLGDLKPAARRDIEARIVKSPREEAEALGTLQSDKALYLYLIRNDQRRHLHRHFDGILSGNFDVQLPIFDANLIESVVRQPIREYLLHRGYMKMLEAHIPEALAAPFQAYPGHVPSPMPCPSGLSNQWLGPDDRTFAKRLRKNTLRKYVDCLKSYPAISDTISLSSLLTGMCMQCLSHGSYGYRMRGAAILLDLLTNPTQRVGRQQPPG